MQTSAGSSDLFGERGAAAMCIPAYGSEFYKLSESERDQVIEVAIEANAGRVPFIAQANHGSALVAAANARRYERMGADVVSIAVPRLFGLTDPDVRRYHGRVADSISVPMLVQDFNPGGPTMAPAEIAELNRQHPNSKYAKLEEPLMVDKVIAIRDRVGDRVGVLEGWGGMYMLELIPYGICVVMPGVPLLEPLDHAFQLARAGKV
jgi:4-hydroxy-tetrahydrodipicolinate synthase